MLESLYRAGFNIADEQLDDDARQASFFLPYPARSLFGPEKPVPRPVPAKAGLSERPEPVKTRPLARDRKIFCPSLQKIPDPLLTGEDAEIASTQTGRSPLQSKTPALLGCPTLLPARKDSVGIETGGGVFHNRAGTTTGKNLPEESIGLWGVRLHESTRA